MSGSIIGGGYVGGHGGYNTFGQGGAIVAPSAAGNPAFGLGGGGGGAADAANTARAGGAGKAGLVIVMWNE